MQVKSIFEFKFPEAAQEEGIKLCTDVGHDMVPLDGYVDHEVVQDVKDPGHLTVSTLWKDQQACTAVLSTYRHNEKITRATQLIGASSVGFTGRILPKLA